MQDCIIHVGHSAKARKKKKVESIQGLSELIDSSKKYLMSTNLLPDTEPEPLDEAKKEILALLPNVLQVYGSCLIKMDRYSERT